MLSRSRTTSIVIFHNVLWSRYKGAIFAALNVLAMDEPNSSIRFVQIAETEKGRLALSPIVAADHNYPFELLFTGAYQDIPRKALCARLASYLWKSKPDVVVLPGYHSVEYWLMLFIAKLLGCRIGVFCDSTAYDNPSTSRLKRILKSFFFRSCHRIFAYGERAKEYLEAHGVDPAVIVTDCQSAAAVVDGYAPALALQLRVDSMREPAPRTFLFVGRLVPQKRVDLLIAAFDVVRKACADVRLELVGTGPDMDALAHQVATLGLQDLVCFTGPVNGADLARRYQSAYCLVLSSSSEPWGLVVNEALAWGCPVIVSDRCGCVPELVSKSAAGIVFQADSQQSLVDAMQEGLRKFVDVEATFQDCIDVVGKYTPEAAAKKIKTGLDAMTAVVGNRPYLLVEKGTK